MDRCPLSYVGLDGLGHDKVNRKFAIINIWRWMFSLALDLIFVPVPFAVPPFDFHTIKKCIKFYIHGFIIEDGS